MYRASVPLKRDNMNLRQLAQSLSSASRTWATGIKQIESKLPGAIATLPVSGKIDALQVISKIHQDKQMLTSEILRKLGGNNGNGQKANGHAETGGARQA